MHANVSTTLADLLPGTRFRVVGFHKTSEELSGYTSQLMRLGLVPGTEVVVVRRAPLGDPMEIRLRGFSLALRPSEAEALEIEVLP